MRTEEIVFQEYQTNPTETLRDELLALISLHTQKVIWLELHQNRKDLVNLVLERVLKSLDSFRGDAKFTTWVEAIIRNAIADELRNIIRGRRDVPFESQHEAIQEEENKLHAKLEIEGIRDKLEGEDRELFLLKLEGASFQEIQRALALPSEEAARKRWQRLTEKIQEGVCA